MKSPEEMLLQQLLDWLLQRGYSFLVWDRSTQDHIEEIKGFKVSCKRIYCDLYEYKEEEQ